VGVEALAHEALVALGLGEMRREGVGQTGSPAMSGAARIWASACSSMECASVRYLMSCSSMARVVMRTAIPGSIP
jgi:hypothetical protein